MRRKTVNRGLTGLGVLLLGLAYCWWTAEAVVIESAFYLFSTYPNGGDPDPQTALRELKYGEIGTLIHVRYGKDRMFYKIRLPDGPKGYVMFPCCRVVPQWWLEPVLQFRFVRYCLAFDDGSCRRSSIAH